LDSQQVLDEKHLQPLPGTQPQQPQTQTQQQEQKSKGKKCKEILRIIWVQLFENGVGAVSSVYISVGDISYLAEPDPRPLEPKPYFSKRWRRRKQKYSEKGQDVVLKDL